jgi:hypothetical protein
MTKAKIARGVAATALVLLAVAAAYRALERDVDPVAPPSPAIATATALPSAAIAPSGAPAAAEAYQGFLYGRITAVGGSTYEGRLRWGDGEEVFWGDYFNGTKEENAWVAQVPPERLPKKSDSLEIFGVKIAERERAIDLRRPFMARFGDIARIEALGKDVRVTLKSGTVFDLDRFEASDFDDGVRVWDAKRGQVDLDSLRIRTIELLPTAPLVAVANRLHGTVRSRQGDFTGFLQWNREACVGADELRGRTAEGELSLRFDSIRSIARHSPDSSLVTLLDGREIVLAGTREVGDGHRGIYLDDRRYGRVLIFWDAFERVDFRAGAPGDTGPAYDSFPSGGPLAGTVTTRAGSRLAGRLVYDLDESETTETLDAESQGVHYTIPFGLIAAVVPLAPDAGGVHRAQVLLHAGEELQLAGTGDVDQRHAGLLVFTPGDERPEYVRWEEVQRIDFERPPGLYSPLR